MMTEDKQNKRKKERAIAVKRNFTHPFFKRMLQRNIEYFLEKKTWKIRIFWI